MKFTMIDSTTMLVERDSRAEIFRIGLLEGSLTRLNVKYKKGGDMFDWIEFDITKYISASAKWDEFADEFIRHAERTAD